MSIKLEENDHIVCFWHAEIPDEVDFLMLLRRNEKWIIDYRFRYIKDSKVFKSNDEKHFQRFTVPLDVTLDYVLKAANVVWNGLVENFGFMNAICQKVDGGPDKFLKVMKNYSSIFHIEENKNLKAL